ncbi:hypothetical protein FHS42_003479 [Streptomyces zagrosensis]|uniref:Uncharacterized protein n=1 Tax=Streptomyces zagrosensis TaxID=1042984 RepID=A0A7W9V043_9ACTN|nr:hypothetical protein [Streptomyces zagrosensis]
MNRPKAPHLAYQGRVHQNESHNDAQMTAAPYTVAGMRR